MSMPAILNKAGLYVIAFFAVAISLYALSYYLSAHGFLASKGNLSSTPYWRTAFYIHAGSGSIALGTGWLQFLKKFRKRNINRHRLTGKIYTIAILVFGATSGMVLAINASGGLVAKLGFGCLALAWFFTTLQGWLFIVKGNVLQHRLWMTRSYAITLAAVTLRIWLPLALVCNLPIQDAYPAISWFCWVPNVLVTEWIILPAIIKTYSIGKQAKLEAL